jgi:adenylate kinase
MTPSTILFIGPQGSGKGTQLESLATYLRTVDPKRKTNVFQSGTLFRTFARGHSYTADHIATTINTGELQPLFLSVGLWAREMIDYMNDDVHALIDGFPRTESEAKVLTSALDFYKRDTRHVIVLEAPEEIVRERMQKRAREDDTPDAIEKRLMWYRTETGAILAYLEKTPGYVIHRIDALQPIDDVQAQIRTALGL